MWQKLKWLVRALLHTCFGIYFWLLFLLCALLALAAIIFLPTQSARRKIARSAAAFVFRATGSYPEVTGIDNLPDTPCVVVANHASYLDGPLLTAILPARFQFVIKREITRIPLVHFFLRRIGAHFVERFDPQRGAVDARKILTTASQGASLAFFPEGTFSSDAGLRRFHNGAFTIASRNGMPVVPIVINGTRDMLPANRTLPRPGKLSITITTAVNNGAPISNVASALEESRGQILLHLNEADLMKPLRTTSC